MDHLTLWPGATWQEGDYVPYVAREDYIGVPFLEYLKPYFQLEDLKIAARLPDRERDCILQTCFFVSLLKKFLAHYSLIRICQACE
ncbi:hypothetical protein CKM354_000152300 [Cercospora kikuchii]|uniref:Uncharacterized protein n=1 Tax=Cercospora kikuchii TaxID=84275 RepID=A0A9P3FCS7_9PEZI|nr:uncharacterized protein CKM354_000152300 [Cercospora kikuchii]GIZ38099.1 hypothetical protein CKM354_000152300 [Cercospora kikuchii]